MAFYPSDGDNHADMAVTALPQEFLELFVVFQTLATVESVFEPDIKTQTIFDLCGLYWGSSMLSL